MKRYSTKKAKQFILDFCHYTKTVITHETTSTVSSIKPRIETDEQVVYHKKIYSVADYGGEAVDLYEYDTTNYGLFREVIQYKDDNIICIALVPWAAITYGSPDYWFCYCPNCKRPFDPHDKDLNFCICKESL